MAYPDTQETHAHVTDNVTEYAAEHQNFTYDLTARIQDYVGYTTDTADPNGTITAQVKDLQDELIGSSFPTGTASATHGPVSTIITDTSGHDVVASPGAGLAVFVTQIAAWNETTTAARLTASDGTNRFRARLAATDGAGFVHEFDPPWELPEATPLTIAMDASITALVDVNFYTAEPTV